VEKYSKKKIVALVSLYSAEFAFYSCRTPYYAFNGFLQGSLSCDIQITALSVSDIVEWRLEPAVGIMCEIGRVLGFIRAVGRVSDDTMGQTV
jgi:hypothetical protein